MAASAPPDARPPPDPHLPSPAEARRRRRGAFAALAGLAALALVAGVVAGSVGGGAGQGRRTPAPARDAERSLERLSLVQRVGQTLVLSFRGSRPPAYVLDVLREGRAAGVVLFRDNATSRAQLGHLTGRLQRAAAGSALIAADQEGGAIRIVAWAAPGEGQAAQSSEREAAVAARDTARDLAAAGVNVDLAPVADVGDPDGSAVGGRAYPGDARRVAAQVTAAVRALGAGRVAATPKHFPGFGSAQANTDDEPVTIGASRAEIERRDLEPFRAAIAAGSPLVMASHALYPALDRRRIASQSPTVLGDLLRRRLGFRGAVVTDSLEATAVTRRAPVDVAAVRSLRAGADLILMTGPGSFPSVRDRVLATAQRDAAFRRRVDEAAARVLAVKRRLGLRPPAGALPARDRGTGAR
jgi:beta-N-acetylhexosaminidase